MLHILCLEVSVEIHSHTDVLVSQDGLQLVRLPTVF